MIVEYHRPNSILEALTLLSREQPLSFPLGGGTVLNREVDENYAVIDLQALGLEKIHKKGNFLQIGATVSLQALLELKGLPEELYKAIEHEATYNLRQMATIAGKVVTAGGRSPLVTALLALDASLEILKLSVKAQSIKMGDWLPLRTSSKSSELITMISFPMTIHFAYEYIARTPADQPIICVAVAQWNSGRTRLALGGWGSTPTLAMDGPNSDGIEIAGMDAYSFAEDQWASSEYRQEMAGVLSLRCLRRINQER
jgi:CO/xanthine dehydrogenase FAD-binding subunit